MMDRNAIRRQLSENGIQVSGARISKIAKELGMPSAASTDYDEAQVRRIVSALSNAVNPQPSQEPRKPTEETFAAAEDEAAMVLASAFDVGGFVGSIREAKAAAVEAMSNVIVEEVETFNTDVLASVAEKLSNRRKAAKAVLPHISIVEAFDDIRAAAARQIDQHPDIALLPEATGHHR